MNYQIFSTIYDELMDKELYKNWLAFSKKHLRPSSEILELAIGTGDHAILLAKSGYKVRGLDLSADMLTLAQQKQVENGVSFPLIQGNMLHLDDLGTYDGILCYADSICYLKNLDELDHMFNQVYRSLNPKGRFLFDVHSPLKIMDFIGYTFHAETDQGVFLWDSYPGPVENSIDHELQFFIPNSEGTYDRYLELHQERTYALEEYIKLLEKNGFSKIEVVSDFSDKLDSDGLRWLFKAEK